MYENGGLHAFGKGKFSQRLIIPITNKNAEKSAQAFMRKSPRGSNLGDFLTHSKNIHIVPFAALTTWIMTARSSIKSMTFRAKPITVPTRGIHVTMVRSFPNTNITAKHTVKIMPQFAQWRAYSEFVPDRK